MHYRRPSFRQGRPASHRHWAELAEENVGQAAAPLPIRALAVEAVAFQILPVQQRAEVVQQAVMCTQPYRVRLLHMLTLSVLPGLRVVLEHPGQLAVLAEVA